MIVWKLETCFFLALFWSLIPTYFGQLTQNLIPASPLLYGPLWYNFRENHTIHTSYCLETRKMLVLAPFWHHNSSIGHHNFSIVFSIGIF